MEKDNEIPSINFSVKELKNIDNVSQEELKDHYQKAREDFLKEKKKIMNFLRKCNTNPFSIYCIDLHLKEKRDLTKKDKYNIWKFKKKKDEKEKYDAHFLGLYIRYENLIPILSKRKRYLEYIYKNIDHFN